MATKQKRNKMKEQNWEEGRWKRRERKRSTTLEVGLKGAGRRGSPWEADTREGKKGQSMEAGGRQGGGKTSRSFKLADTKLTEEFNKNQGWIIIRLLTAGFQLEHKQIILPHCQPPPVRVRCPQIQGKRLGKFYDQENPSKLYDQENPCLTPVCF